MTKPSAVGRAQARALSRRRRPWIHLAVAALVTLAAPAAGQTVVDGDAIELDGKTYRLYGVDAAEAHQVCLDGWRAGNAARAYLGELIRGKQVVCTPWTGDRGDDSGEVAAICRADGVDLGAAMVTGGQALAYVPYSARYISQEATAKAARRGVHAHECAPPWEWRARRSPD